MTSTTTTRLTKAQLVDDLAGRTELTAKGLARKTLAELKELVARVEAEEHAAEQAEPEQGAVAGALAEIEAQLDAESAARKPAKRQPKAKATKAPKPAEKPARGAAPAKAVPAAQKCKADDGAVRKYRHIFAKALATNSAAVLAFSGLDVEATVSGTWAEADLHIVGSAAEVAKAHKLLDVNESAALAAMQEWAATEPTRKTQTGYERRVESRRFVEAYLRTVATRLAGKAPKGSRGESPASRAGRTAGIRAELLAA